MKRQTLLKSTLCLLMALVCNVTWAQTFVLPEAGKYYKLKGDNSAKPWLTNQLNGNSIVVSANEADAAVFEKTTNGLKDVATGKYLGMNGSVVSLVANETNVTIGEYYNDTEDGRKYSVKASNNFMYNNNTDGKTHESSNWMTTIERYWGFIEVKDVKYLVQLSNGCSYEVHGQRGFIYAKNDDNKPAAVNNADGNTSNDIEFDADNSYHHFAIVKYEDNYYLYNVGTEKFLVRNGNNGVAFSDIPAETVTIEASNNATYPWIIKLGGEMINISNGGGHTNSVRIAGTSGPDEGARWAITKVGDFDPTHAIWVIENYDRQLPIKVVVDGLEANNPNTHFGSVRATSESGATLTKLLRGEADALTMVNYDGTKTNTIDFTRAYRGFEFQGFYVGDRELDKSFTLDEELKALITAENPLVAKFTATEAVTLFYDDDEFSYRIPAIATTGTGRIIAVSDYRHNLDDVGRDNHRTGTLRIDLVARTSDDNGKTWSNVVTIAEGDNSKAGSYLRAFGDAAIAAVGENIVVMAAAGDVMYGNASSSNPNRMARIFSSDNGATWSVEEMTTKMYLSDTSLIPSGVGAFFGSGKLAVDADFNGTGKARIYGALLIKNASRTDNNYVVYSDDLGATWKILGGNQSPIAYADEPKAEILPNGQILLSSRRQGGRVFNVFTYGTGDTDKANGVGTWGSAVNGCNNGGSNGTNGEIFCLNAKNVSGNPVKLLLQSQPKGGSGHYDRNDVTIWYKEITDADDTPSEIAGNWTEGLQISYQKSAYSAMSLQKDGRIALFFEEAPCYGDDHTKGYSMVYMPLTIEQITKSNYFSLDADLTTERTINVVLTDAQGNEYRQQVTSALGGVATKLTTDYPYITLGNNAALESDGEAFTYTNTVTLPFKVSNEENVYWHNIYWPSNGNDASQRYPVYLSASAAGDEFVPKVTESNAYGNSSYNTAGKADNISWAVYSVNDGFAFKFKNKLTGKFIQATGVATGNGKNVKYVDEASATAFVLDNVKQGDKCYGDYALKAEINGTVGYLCSTSATNYHFATHYNGKGHAGAWVKFAEAPDFEALFAEVNAVLNMFGDGLGQYSNVSAENLTAVNAAKEAMKNASSVKKSVLDSYKTYTSKTEGGTLNLPKDGQSFRVAYDYGGNVGKLYMQGTASSEKGLQFSAETGEASIWLYYDGTLYSYEKSKNLREHGNDRGLSDTKTTVEFSASTRAKGKYNVKCGSFIHANSSNGNYFTDHCSSDGGHAAHDLILEEIEPTTVTIRDLGYSTLYSEVALSIPNGVKAYTGEYKKTASTLTLKEIADVIPANTGVVLESQFKEGEEKVEKTFNFTITAKVNPIEGNILRGTAINIPVSSVTDGVVYTLQPNENENGVVFKRYADDENPNLELKAGKAYLVLPAPENGDVANSISIRFEGTTDIEHSTLNPEPSTQIYDLLGRRVEAMTKGGIYIVNGKKVVIK